MQNSPKWSLGSTCSTQSQTSPGSTISRDWLWCWAVAMERTECRSLRQVALSSPCRYRQVCRRWTKQARRKRTCSHTLPSSQPSRALCFPCTLRPGRHRSQPSRWIAADRPTHVRRIILRTCMEFNTQASCLPPGQPAKNAVQARSEIVSDHRICPAVVSVPRIFTPQLEPGVLPGAKAKSRKAACQVTSGPADSGRTGRPA